jgi:Domain of unknown function (DUF4347)/Cadherin-like
MLATTPIGAIKRRLQRARSRTQFSALEGRTLYSADLGLAGGIALTESGMGSKADSPAAVPAAYAKIDAQKQSISTSPTFEAVTTDNLNDRQTFDDLLKLSAEPSVESQTRPLELVLIDSRVPDLQVVRDSFQQMVDTGRNLVIMVIDTQTDGIQRATLMLENAGQSVSAIHFISHGQTGTFAIGSSVMDSQTIESRSSELAAWSRYLSSDADLLIYGCDVAGDSTGEQFVVRLGEITGADVAASKDLTGAEKLGGNWDLEWRAGQIQTTSVASTELQLHWDNLLTPSTIPVGAVNQLTAGSQAIDTVNGNGRNISVNKNGDVAVAWVDVTNRQVMAGLFRADGSSKTSDIAVFTQLGNENDALHTSPVVAMRDDGSFVVAWVSVSGPGKDQLFAQRYTAQGNALGARITVSSGLGHDNIQLPDIAVDHNGNFVIAYQMQDGSASFDVKVSGFDQAGNARFIESTVSVNPYYDGEASIAVNPGNGTFVVSWTAFNPFSGSLEIGATRFDSNGVATTSIGGSTGSPIASSLWVNRSRASDQYQSSIALADDGSFTVSYTSTVVDGSNNPTRSDILLQKFNSDDTYLNPEQPIAQGGTAPWNYFSSVAVNSSNSAVVVWQQSTTSIEGGFANAKIQSVGTANFGYQAGTGFVPGASTTGYTFTTPRVSSNGNMIATAFTRIATPDYTVEVVPGGLIYHVNQETHDVAMTLRQSDTSAYTATPPLNMVPLDQTILENSATLDFSLIAGNAIQVSNQNSFGVLDVDLTASVGGQFRIANPGIVTNPNTGLPYGPNLEGMHLTLRGTQTQLNQALSQLQFVPFRDFNGAATVNVTTTQQYGTNQAALSQFNIFVSPVNSAPTALDQTRIIPEDSAFTFGINDFGFNDSLDTPSNLLASVQITALPTRGSLTLANVDVSLNQKISRADLVNGKLAFRPDSNDHASSYASLSFLVADDGGTANGGVATAGAARTFNFGVSPVDDAPILIAKRLTISEGGTVVLNNSMIGTTDVDSTDSQLLYTVTGVTQGRFERVAMPGVFITVFNQAEVNSGAIQFVHFGAQVAPTFLLQVSDGTTSLPAIAGDIGYLDINNVPNISYTGPPVPIAEGSSKAYSSSGLNSIILSDLDAGGSTVELTLTTHFGRINLASLAGITISSGADGSSSMTLLGSMVSLNNALEGLLVSPNSNFNGSTSLDIVLNDLGNTGSGGALNATLSIPITVLSVNDAPSSVDQTRTIIEDVAPYVFTAADFVVLDPSDTPANTLYDVTITSLPVYGRLLFQGLAVAAGDRFLAADLVNNNLLFLPDINAYGNNYVNFGFQVRDNGGIANSGVDLDPIIHSFTFNVTPVNDAPAITANALSIGEGGSVVITNSNISGTDVDNTAIQLTYTVIAPTHGQFERVGSPGIASVLFTQEDINASRVRFVHDGSQFAPSYSLMVSDGAISSSVEAAIINFSNVNTPPVINSVLISIALNEDQSQLFSTANGTNITLTDLDASTSQVELSISAANSTVSLAGLNGLTVTSGANRSSALTLRGTVSDLNLALDGLVLAPLANFSGSTSLSLTLDDLGNSGSGGPKQATLNIPLTVSAVNDAPNGSDTTVTTAEDRSIVFKAADFGFADTLDSPSNGFSGIVISSLPSQGTLTLAGRMVTINQFISNAELANGSLLFTPNAGDNGAGYSRFNFQVQDDGGSALDGVDLDPTQRLMTIDVLAVNSPPLIAATQRSISINEDGSHVFSSVNNNAIVLSDPDTGSGLFELSLSVAHSQIDLASIDGVSFISGANSSTSMVLRGALPALNAALDSMKITPMPNYNGSDGLNISLDDLGNTGSGGHKVYALTLPITVLSENDLPVIQNAQGVALDAGAAVTLSDAALLATDLESNAANIVYTLGLAPGQGQLLLNGIALRVGDEFTQADVNRGSLSFRAAETANGVDQIQLSVRDQHGGFGPPIRLSMDVKGKPSVSYGASAGSTGTTSDTSSTSSVVVTSKADAKALAENAGGAPGALPGFAGGGSAPSEGETATAEKQAGSQAGAGNTVKTSSSNSTSQSNTNNASARPETARLPDSSFTPLAALANPALSTEPVLREGSESGAKPIETEKQAPIPLGISLPINALPIDKISSDTGFQRTMEKVREDLMQVSSLDRGAVASTIGVSASFTIGYILWLVRGGVLISSLLASLPAWRMVDPLPVLGSLDRKNRHKDDKSLEELIEASQDAQESVIDEPPELGNAQRPKLREKALV